MEHTYSPGDKIIDTGPLAYGKKRTIWKVYDEYIVTDTGIMLYYGQFELDQSSEQ